MARCVCYQGFDFAPASIAAEQGLVWELVQQINPTRLPAPASFRALTFTPTFLADGDPEAAEAAVSRILGGIDARQGTRLLADGYVTPLGDDYLEAYVSGVRFLLPGIHYGVGQTMQLESVGRAESEDTVPIGGPIIDEGLESIESLLGIPSSMAGGLVVGGLAVIAMVGAGRAAPQLPGAGLIAGALVLVMGALAGWLPMWTLVAVGVVASLVGAWMMFLRKG